MLKSILGTILLLLAMNAQAALVSDSGVLTPTSQTHSFDFNVAEQSGVHLWETSPNDFRINLYDGDDNTFVATNDDWAWGTNAGGWHSGQAGTDASLYLPNLVGNYTAVVKFWASWNDSYSTGPFNLYVQGEHVTAGHRNNVPEPGVLAMLGMGIIGFLGMRKKRVLG